MQHSRRIYSTPDARLAAIMAGDLVISGADDAPEGETPAEAEAPTETPAAEAPAPDAPEGETPAAEGETPAADAPEPLVVPDVPEVLTEADEEALRGSFAALQAFRDAHPIASISTADELGAVEEAHQRQVAIRAEFDRRAAEAQALATRIGALSEAELVTIPEPEPVPVQASAAAIAGARGRQPAGVQTPPAAAPPSPARPRMAIQASAGLSTANMGDDLSLIELGQAIDDWKGMEVARGRGPHGDKKMTRVRLASVAAFEDMRTEDRAMLPELLSKSNVDRNDELIALAQADFRERQRAARDGRDVDYPAARQAAAAEGQGALVTGAELATADDGGAPCLPFDIIRQIPDAFTATEPTSGVFPTRPMTRLGFMFTPSGVLEDVEAGVANWFDADQAAVDPDDNSTWKPIVDLVCPDAYLMRAEWVVAGVRFDNVLEMSNPERIANMMSALNAVFARTKEARKLEIIDSLCSPYTFTGSYGALPSFIQAVNTLVAQAVEDQRLSEANYTMLLPEGIVQQLAIDRANTAFGQGMSESDVIATLNANLDGVTSIVEPLLDWSRAGDEPGHPFNGINPVGGAAIEVPSLDGYYRVRLVVPESAIYSEVGSVNTGVMRSPDLMRMNKAVTFREEGFALAKNGPNHWFTLDVGLCASGIRADVTAGDYSCGDVS